MRPNINVTADRHAPWFTVPSGAMKQNGGLVCERGTTEGDTTVGLASTHAARNRAGRYMGGCSVDWPVVGAYSLPPRPTNMGRGALLPCLGGRTDGATYPPPPRTRRPGPGENRRLYLLWSGRAGGTQKEERRRRGNHEVVSRTTHVREEEEEEEGPRRWGTARTGDEEGEQEEEEEQWQHRDRWPRPEACCHGWGGDSESQR